MDSSDNSSAQPTSPFHTTLERDYRTEDAPHLLCIRYDPELKRGFVGLEDDNGYSPKSIQIRDKDGKDKTITTQIRYYTPEDVARIIELLEKAEKGVSGWRANSNGDMIKTYLNHSEEVTIIGDEYSGIGLSILDIDRLKTGLYEIKDYMLREEARA